MKYLFHGSAVPNISKLETRSILHGTSGTKVVYLTENIPYALFCIWDKTHNDDAPAHITGWTEGEITFYEEQFPEQLKTFYKGVSGYLYCVKYSEEFLPVAERDRMYFSVNDVIAENVEFIPDVYEELMKYEALGKFKILRYNEQSAKRQEELTDLIAAAILRCNFFADEGEIQRQFMKKHFPLAWEKAKKIAD